MPEIQHTITISNATPAGNDTRYERLLALLFDEEDES